MSSLLSSSLPGSIPRGFPSSTSLEHDMYDDDESDVEELRRESSLKRRSNGPVADDSGIVGKQSKFSSDVMTSLDVVGGVFATTLVMTTVGMSSASPSCRET